MTDEVADVIFGVLCGAEENRVDCMMIEFIKKAETKHIMSTGLMYEGPAWVRGAFNWFHGVLILHFKYL